MKTDWTKTVNAINRSRYTIPEGWDTRDQVAESLQCDPDKVADILKPGVQSGEIERQEFPVWDDKRRLTTRVVCYRIAGEKPPVETGRPRLYERIAAAIARNPKKTNREIARNIRGSSSGEVAKVRLAM